MACLHTYNVLCLHRSWLLGLISGAQVVPVTCVTGDLASVPAARLVTGVGPDCLALTACLV